MKNAKLNPGTVYSTIVSKDTMYLIKPFQLNHGEEMSHLGGSLNISHD
jgi:hypothetical protein